MKNILKNFLALIAVTGCVTASASTSAIRVNRVGYLTDDIKTAVIMLDSADTADTPVEIINLTTGRSYTPTVTPTAAWEPMAACLRVDFTGVTEPGRYVVSRGKLSSPQFGIGDNVYAGLNELPLAYMRQQRCGHNASLGTDCHPNDALVVLGGELDGKHFDVTGGWHDASDYLQYLTTSANAVFQLLFAYQQSPAAWGDRFDAAGNATPNGVPDILDEARWGLEWMMKMNPADSLYFNQIADDRDHRFYGLPADDTADYGWGPGKARPVYLCSAQPQGLMKNKNRSTGLASSVGKFSSSFSLGSEVFRNIDPQFAAELETRAAKAYNHAKANPGACQTAPCVSPYFYEEDNWVDDMELAAIKRYHATGDPAYRLDAIAYGRMEPVTPWMGADSARHYQWYPFINLGHAMLAADAEGKVAREFTRNMRSGLQRVADRADGNAFMSGVPFVWCSNSLTVALVTQAMLYRRLTGDNSYRPLETAARDWLMGLNPWGQAMIVGLTDEGSPVDPHSALSHKYGIPTTGGLVDGPVYATIFNSLRGVHLEREDPFAPYQNSTVVYHDDNADYSTNEPTMDGTASTTFMLGLLANP